MNNRIRDLREDHDLTQQQIADVIGITQRKYSYLETGKQQLTECRLFYCPILPSRCRFCSFLKLLSYRHTAKALPVLLAVMRE